MQEGFIKYGKNQVAQMSQITTIFEIGIELCFSTPEMGNDDYWHVKPEYEQEWRDRFDLNDDKPQGEIPF